MSALAIDWPRAYRGRTTLARFMSRIDRRSETGCWIWTGALTDQGYGSFRAQQRTFLAHRAMFVLWYGDVPAELDHLCRTPRCVSPEHLEPVTHRENVLRGTSPSSERARATHCKNGHAWTPDNTSHAAGGTRRCKACHRANEAARYARKAVSR